MKKSVQFICTITLLSSSASMAGTIIEIKNKNDVSTILTDGKKARMNTAGAEYVIIDYKDNSVKVIDPKKQQVMLFDIDDMPKSDKAPKVRTLVKNLGAGPVIAGYKTQKFGYTVNDKSCGIIYGSKDAYKTKDLKDLFDAMKTMAQRQQAMMGNFAGMVDDCTLGDMEMSGHMNTVGVPMRTEDKGVVDSEIKSIKLDVVLPASTFVIPASYKTATIKEEIQKATKDMQQHQPQMQQMMEQMQQSGKMPPEAMEQIRRAHEMMKQYQQQ